MIYFTTGNSISNNQFIFTRKTKLEKKNIINNKESNKIKENHTFTNTAKYEMQELYTIRANRFLEI